MPQKKDKKIVSDIVRPRRVGEKPLSRPIQRPGRARPRPAELIKEISAGIMEPEAAGELAELKFARPLAEEMPAEEESAGLPQPEPGTELRPAQPNPLAVKPFPFQPRKEGFITRGAAPLRPAGSRRFVISLRIKLIGVLVLFILLIGGYAAAVKLPYLEIDLVLTRKNLELNEAINADKNVAAVIEKQAILPGVFFSQKGNLAQNYPASGRKNVSLKAKGKIIIYNTFASSPQGLVASTRFLTPDNKIFRLDKAVTVPAAKIVDGKIIAASTTASVTADEPGEGLNIGPVVHFILPGFKGTPKYDGFYGESKEPMSGGFVGELAVPTPDDLKSARASLTKNLQDALKQKIIIQWPEDFKLITGASDFKILSEEVINKVPEAGKFGLFAEAEMRMMAFREVDLQNFLKAKAVSQLEGDYEVLISDLEYGSGRLDSAKGVMSFPVKAKMTLRRSADLNLIRQQIAGKSETDLNAVIYALPGLQNAKVSFWPFWVSHAPRDINRITVKIQ